MNNKILTLATLLALSPAMSLGASVYKWTDENGVTHFGDRQPTGQSTEQVDIRTGGPSGNQATRRSPQEQMEDIEEGQQQERQNAEETAVEEARRKQREANCETARSNLKILNQNSRIRVEEEGEQRYLSPEEIEEKRQEFQEAEEEYCGPPSE